MSKTIIIVIAVLGFLTFIYLDNREAIQSSFKKQNPTPSIELVRCYAAYGAEMTRADCYRYAQDKKKQERQEAQYMAPPPEVERPVFTNCFTDYLGSTYCNSF